MALPQHELTLEELLVLPEEKPALEYVDGRVRGKLSPQLLSGVLQLHLGKWFDAVGMPGKVARAITEPRTTFAGQSRVPDLAVFRWARLPRDEHGRVASACVHAPDIVVEISSPGQTVAALTRNCEWYVAHGVELALLVLLNGERMRVFRSDQLWRELRGDDAIDLDPIIPDARLSVRELFSALDAD